MLKTKGGWALEASARRRGSHRRRARIVRTLTSRRPVLAIFLVFVLIALYALAAGFVLLTSRSNLETGATDLRRAQSLLTLSAIKRSPARTIRTMEHNLSVAESHFHTADQRLALFSMVFDHLGRVPKFGSEIAGAAPAARMADQATSGTLDLVRGIKPIFGRSGAHHVPLRSLLTGIAAQKPRFLQACSSLHAAQNTRLALNGNRAATLAGPLRTFDHEIPKLVTLCHALVYAPAVLGFPHPVTYLVGYLNPHQIRATGGFLGSQALVTVHLGKVSTRFKSTAFLDRLTYLPPEPIRLDEGEPAWLFRDSNWSPDFPTSAALERFFLKLDEHQSVQGVINLT
ncbi:MAG: DUF4012 domain-containing protein, partial [Chloroflexota bacterium]